MGKVIQHIEHPEKIGHVSEVIGTKLIVSPMDKDFNIIKGAKRFCVDSSKVKLIGFIDYWNLKRK